MDLAEKRQADYERGKTDNDHSDTHALIYISAYLSIKRARYRRIAVSDGKTENLAFAGIDGKGRNKAVVIACRAEQKSAFCLKKKIQQELKEHRDKEKQNKIAHADIFDFCGDQIHRECIMKCGRAASEADRGRRLTRKISVKSRTHSHKIYRDKGGGNKDSAKQRTDIHLDMKHARHRAEGKANDKCGYKSQPCVYIVINKNTVCNRSRKEGSLNRKIGKIQYGVGYIISHCDKGKNKSRFKKNLYGCKCV